MQTDDEATPRRQFGIADGLLFIGATAVAFAIVRSWANPQWAEFLVYFRMHNQTINPIRQFNYNISRGIAWTIPFGIMLSLALIVARLRLPRRPLKKIASQPGFIACIAAMFPVAFHFASESLTWTLAFLTRPQSSIRLPSPPFMRFDNPGFHPPADRWLRSVLIESFPILVAPAVFSTVVISWCILKISGAWRSEPSWVDRFGRLLGFYWITVCLAIPLLTKVWMFLA